MEGNEDRTWDEEPEGGEPACWAHLLDEEGRIPDAPERPGPDEAD